MAKNAVRTSRKVASAASRALRASGSKSTKRLAGSALSNRRK